MNEKLAEIQLWYSRLDYAISLDDYKAIEECKEELRLLGEDI